MGGTHLPLTLPAFQFQLPFMLISIFFPFILFSSIFFFLHPVALKLLLVPGEQSPWHRGCAGIRTFPAAFTHVLCVAQLSFIFFLSEAFVGLVGAALCQSGWCFAQCSIWDLNARSHRVSSCPSSFHPWVKRAVCLFSGCVVAFLQPQEGGKATWRKMG